MKIEGEIAVGEAARYAGKATSRINGHPKPMILANAITVAVLLPLIFVFSAVQGAFDWPAWLFLPAIVLAGVIATIVGMRVCRAYAIRLARRALAQRGLRSPIPNLFEINPEGLRSLTGTIDTRAPWTSVSDLFVVGPYWVVIADAWPFYLPRRFFSSVEEEKRFLGSMLEHMAEEAQARSEAAARFVAS